jgi:hypothetical protein
LLLLKPFTADFTKRKSFQGKSFRYFFEFFFFSLLDWYLLPTAVAVLIFDFDEFPETSRSGTSEEQ